jgi:fumarate hydratase class II
MAADTRVEHDAFGPVQIPADHLWGAQTQRALELFAIGEERFPAGLYHAFGLQKLAAARANRRLGVLDDERGAAIEAAAAELRDGLLDRHFPLTIWQTGSGTQTNMNANEVLANRANQLLGQPLGTRSPVHPNDHANASQSSNDSFPTVMHLATALELRDHLLPALALLRQRLQERALAFAGVLKVARTHLMDAVPMTLGQSFETFAHQMGHGIHRLQATQPRLWSLAQGGTAAGTGLNAPAGFDRVFCEEIQALTGLAVTPNPCKFEGMAAHDALIEVSGALNVVAGSLAKMANDIRLLGSGPRCGLGELVFPDDGLSSSIMPGKRNPTVAEVVVQAAYQAMGHHLTVTVAKPVLIHHLLRAMRALGDASRVFAEKLVAGLQAHTERLEQQVSHSLLQATALNPVLGYDAVARITREAMARGIAPREAAVELGLVTAAEYDRLVDLRAMAGLPPA